MQDEDPAWLDFCSRFSELYQQSHYSNSLQSKVMRQGHRLLERQFGSSDHFSRVLEIGAGTGEHFSFVRHSFDQYIMTDMDAKTQAVAQKKLQDTTNAEKISFVIQPGNKLSYPDNSFDRVIASHVLEHLYYPHLVLKEWARILKNGGTLSVLIPAEPGLAWKLGRQLGPRQRAIAKGIAYDYVVAREHVNSCNNLISFMRHYFSERVESWWPLPIPLVDLNLFFACQMVIRK